jgi:hypothetical protein
MKKDDISASAHALRDAIELDLAVETWKKVLRDRSFKYARQQTYASAFRDGWTGAQIRACTCSWSDETKLAFLKFKQEHAAIRFWDRCPECGALL